MKDPRFWPRVLLKALLLFIALNLLFAAIQPLPALGKISAYNLLFPGRLRLPFGENSAVSYNLSLYNVDAMFASHEIAGAQKDSDEFRVLVVGDSSVWGTLLKPQETLAGQLNSANLTLCDGRRLRAFNLGYPTLSLTKDLMIIEEGMRYKPDLILWLVTLESFPRDRQLESPLVANNPARIKSLVSAYDVYLDQNQLKSNDFLGRTIIGERRGLADLIRLQSYGVMWAATGVDQVYPADYEKAAHDLEADTSFEGQASGPLVSEDLSLDVLEAGFKAAGSTPVLLVNEPIMISSGENSDLRYNFYYPRWAYDDYRSILSSLAGQHDWNYLDLWNLVAETEYTNSAIHLTPAGEALLTQTIAAALPGAACPASAP